MAPFALIPDEQYAAALWWDALRATHPVLADRLSRCTRPGEWVIVDLATLLELQRLPGWGDGPVYAQTPVVVIEVVERQD